MENIMDVIYKGEIYLTFVFDGLDSTQMKIASVSNGGRYDTPILPGFQDNMLDVDGYNGRYYFNTRIPFKEFRFNCFIDNLSAFELDSIRAWLRPDKIAKLIVPENPYRYHWVKVTSIDNLGNIPLTHPDNGGVSYTGTFSVTFQTIGQAAGYGMFYYVDDLKYYEYRDIFNGSQDHLYDSGLLYKEESLPLNHILDNGIHNFGIYNPGTYPTKISLKILANQIIDNGTVEIINKTTGDVSVIRLENLTAGSIFDIDYAKNEYKINNEDASKYVMGDLLYITARDVVERINNATVFNDGTITRIKFDESIRTVRSDDIGKTVMFKNEQDINAIDGVGGRIVDIDRSDNTFILDSEAGVFTNPNVNVIITKVDNLSIGVQGGPIELQFSVMPRYI